MRKGIYVAGTLLVVAMLGTGCGGSSSQEGNVAVEKDVTQTEQPEASKAPEEEKDIDCDAMTKELVELIGELEPEDEMTLLDDELVRSNYDTISGELYEDAICYLSSGATANEVAVFVCPDEEAAASVEQELSKRVESRTKSYADYNPKEAKKLEKAIIAKNGRYAVLVVAGDEEAAAEIIRKY